MTDLVVRPRHPAGLTLASATASAHVTGVSLDSRAVQPGDLYVALPGLHTHGVRFVDEALERGAVAVLTDAAGAEQIDSKDVPVLAVPDPRAVMGGIAAQVYGWPAEHMQMFGVTGTNGKTSTVFLVQAALRALGHRVATIGTLGTRVDDEQVSFARGTVTTPDSPDLQGILGYLVDAAADSVAMEVSSIGLDQSRVEGITFDVAGWTMFGQDHLDYHGTAEQYYLAKRQLFVGGRSGAAVINIDDEHGRRLVGELRAEGRARIITTSPSGAPADYRVVASTTEPDGTSRVTIGTPHGEVVYGLAMLGSFNIANSLTALAMVGAAGGDVEHAASGLGDAYVPGRMQRIPTPAGAPHVVVDFAHTPQAVEAALAALPVGGRRIAVLGAGGDREAQKRPLMGAAAARHADVVVITDDNPRSEDPAAIRAAVLAGALQADTDAQIVDGGDRREAIAWALRCAGPEDWVAVLGKGHERTQEIDGVRLPFDDVAVVRELLDVTPDDGPEA